MYLHLISIIVYRFLEEFQKQGLKVWSLSGGNEGLVEVFLLSMFSNPTLNSTLLFSPIQRSWFKSYLKPYLASSNFSDVKLITMEDQRVFAPYWMERVSIRAQRQLSAANFVNSLRKLNDSVQAFTSLRTLHTYCKCSDIQFINIL